MQETPGHNPGHAGLSWGQILETLIGQWGSLAGVAAKMAADRGYAEDVGSVERGLRRLRERGHKDGGVWGRRVLATFGLPAAVEDRVRWMGQYHTRFSDLPTSLCRELLLPWDRPPVSESPARVWVQLGLASVALRNRDDEGAAAHLEQVSRAGSTAPIAARLELELVQAYATARRDPIGSDACLSRAAALLPGADLGRDTAICLHARLVDQQAYRLNKPRDGQPDHEAAMALYESIATDGPGFARCRRHNGMGWSLLRLGRRQDAIVHAKASVRVAGDTGSLRLRSMGLNLLAAAASGDEAAAAAARAAAIAERLQDETLMSRYAGTTSMSAR